MKWLKRLVKVAAGIALAGYAVSLPVSTYKVHKTQHTVEKRLGAVAYVESRPGPHLKNNWWIPIWGSYLVSIERMEKRLLEYEDKPEKILTEDGKYILSDRFAMWKIVDPEQYINKTRTEENAQSQLDSIVFQQVWQEMSKHTFDENQITKREEIRKDMIEGGNEIMVPEFGIKIEDLRVKKTNIPKESRGSIHKRMEAEKQQQAAQIRAEGEDLKREWLGKKENQVKEIVSEGRRKVEEIYGDAEKEVAELYTDAFGDDPELYKFLESMDTLTKLKGSKFILKTDNPLLERILKGTEKEK